MPPNISCIISNSWQVIFIHHINMSKAYININSHTLHVIKLSNNNTQKSLELGPQSNEHHPASTFKTRNKNKIFNFIFLFFYYIFFQKSVSLLRQPCYAQDTVARVRLSVVCVRASAMSLRASGVSSLLGHDLVSQVVARQSKTQKIFIFYTVLDYLSSPEHFFLRS